MSQNSHQKNYCFLATDVLGAKRSAASKRVMCFANVYFFRIEFMLLGGFSLHAFVA